MYRCLTLAALLIAAPVTAQTTPAADHGKMRGMDHSKMAGMGEMMKNTLTNSYAEAGMAMHHKMMVIDVNASETWVRQMIEHHRGAIAMSKIAVAQAADKEVRTMAQKDIAIQEQDFASLESCLKRNGKTAQ